ncbi:MAG: response regulator [Silvanigrellaceae bacterium]|nr:response regulator [Silvanigrellaceae bacterium]
MRILFVDDSKAVHAFFKHVFTKEKYECQDAYSGEEALDLILKTPNGYFDVIFMDWEMTGMTGLETLKSLRAAKRSEKIFMLTSKNRVNNIEEALAAGANDYLMKPITSEILLSKIQNHLVG